MQHMMTYSAASKANMLPLLCPSPLLPQLCDNANNPPHFLYHITWQ